MNNKKIHIVHCVDTEGPLYESLEATFQRLKNTFNICISPSIENLNNLKKGIGVDDRLKDIVAEFLSDDRLNYNSTWQHIDNMLEEMLSEKWRNRYKDDFGRGYIFNWFIMDHAGFITNPRRRALGYNVIFDYYKNKLKKLNCSDDEIQWHFHPVSFFKEAHKASNNFSYTNEHIQVLNRKIIDYGWFPAVYRPGMHSERPDINLFLEMWIPFDYGNQGIEKKASDKRNLQNDISDGRWGDWRQATSEWEVYHPDFYNYQVKGSMKRYIARCLNLNARLNDINEYEIEKAFRRADCGEKTILSVTNHDEREMRPYIDWFYKTIRKVQSKYPDVKIKNSGAVEALRDTLNLNKENAIKFDVNFQNNKIYIKSNKKCWGPQPWFCFKTKGQQYIWENLDFQKGNEWTYTFDSDNILLNQIETIGIASNDGFGNTTVVRINAETKNIKEKYYLYK